MLAHQTGHSARLRSSFLLHRLLHVRESLPATVRHPFHIQNQLFSRVHDNPVKFDHFYGRPILYQIEVFARRLLVWLFM